MDMESILELESITAMSILDWRLDSDGVIINSKGIKVTSNDKFLLPYNKMLKSRLNSNNNRKKYKFFTPTRNSDDSWKFVVNAIDKGDFHDLRTEFDKSIKKYKSTIVNNDLITKKYDKTEEYTSKYKSDFNEIVSFYGYNVFPELL